ncbi:hypothetical protein [Actinoalloteichus sp. GBA129-24]|uniref:hypothetical protein n=1 Tax=Actinoalloteichus sp. GBA129-24 TaxID=1612551 RepID=UPI000950607F|nr:hypothetical protein [Actinoalloteichus sp. GBA129-24]APU20904.1 hypothetical protein UA75_14470 [Actinoalloteichus sp. GBA129-24]APU24153.1 hypothetical protein UA75_30950 [Actinoalloteichus sp. GBA129-24]
MNAAAALNTELDDLMSNTTSPVLIATLAALDGYTDGAAWLLRTRITTELETRYPKASRAMDAEFARAEREGTVGEFDQSAILLAAIEQIGA